MANNDKTRYALAAMAVKELHPKMMRKLADLHRNAPTLLKVIERNESGFLSKLNEVELKLVPTLLHSGYDMFDESLMYKIIRFFNIVQPPTNSWGYSPNSRDQTTLGDDIERLRKKRNAVAHSPYPQLSEDQFKDFFDELQDIAQRFDVHLHQSTSLDRLQNEVMVTKRQSLDPEIQTKYILAMEKVYELQKVNEYILYNISIQLFHGKDIKELCAHEEDWEATNEFEELDETVWLNMFVTCINGFKDPEKAVSILQKALVEIKGRCKKQFVVISVQEGSILFHLRAKKRCFKTPADFEKNVLDILKILLPHAKEYLDTNLQVVISVDTVKDDLISNSQDWRRVRTETLPHLRQVEERLTGAEQYIRNFRRARNVTTGLGLLGILTAPFTGGASLSSTLGAVTISLGGVTLGTMIIEYVLAGSLLKEAQDRMNKDEEVTKNLQRRVHFFMERGGTHQEELFARRLYGRFPKAIIYVMRQSFGDYVTSFIDTEVGSVFRAKEQVAQLRMELEAELQIVAEMEREYVCN